MRKHNVTEFAQDYPALIDKGLCYREELLANKDVANPESTKVISDGPIMAKCIKDFGIFSKKSEKNPELQEIASKDDYVFHLTFGLLKECCRKDNMIPIIPRIIMNNIAMKLNDKEITLKVP